MSAHIDLNRGFVCYLRSWFAKKLFSVCILGPEAVKGGEYKL